MSIPPPGLGGGGARTGPPPGFGSGMSNNAVSPVSSGNPGSNGNGNGNSNGQGTTTIVRAQIAFLLSTLTEDSFEKSSNDVRTLASTNGPEMYHHFLRRAAVTAAPIIQTLSQHYQQFKDDPSAPPANIPTTGQPALAWRLLVTEAIRAARDVTLAPHFALVMLSSSQASNGTPLPLVSIRLFNLPATFLFALAAFTLASPHVFPPTHPATEIFHGTLRQTFQPTMELLRTPVPFWSINSIPGQGPYNEDLSLQEARTLILALFPRSISSGGSTSRPATPTNPTSPHHSPLSSGQRSVLISSLTYKFSSPAIILQTLSALSPGGPPRSQGAIPLEDILFELGEALTQDEGTVEAVIGRWWGPWLLEGLSGEERERAVTDEATRTVIGLCEGLREGRSVDLHGVVKGLCSVKSISFADVIRSLDMPASPASYPSSLPLLISLILIPDQSPRPPITGLLPASPSSPVWSSLTSLLNILSSLTTLPPDALPIFTMANQPSPSDLARIIDPPDASMSKTVKKQAQDLQEACIWNTLGLIQVMVAACAKAEEQGGNVDEKAEIGRRATEILEKAATLAPELVLIALEKLPKPHPPPVATMHQRLLEIYLTTSPANVNSSQLVFQQMWSLNPDGLLTILTEHYNEDENHLGRVVDIAWDLKILDRLLASENFHFALDVAALASNREQLKLEKWLADAVAVRGEEFLHAVFEFTEHKIRMETDHQHQPDSIPPPPFTLGTSVYSIILRVIQEASGTALLPENINTFKHIRTDILMLQPRLLNLRPEPKERQDFVNVTFSKEITSTVDEMYRKMYSDEIKLDDVIDELKRCQISEDEKDRQLFACALHSLFDEYKFVKNYPPKELTMTGILFGAVIDCQLLQKMPAFVASRYVLDAVRSPPNESLYQFGICALNVLRGSLVEFPALCRQLLEIPALHESHPGLINDIHQALAEREELDQQGGVKLAFPALKLPILIEEGVDEFKIPDDKKKDAIMFIINNIAPSNYEAKSADLIRLFEDQYSRWFAHYFIEMRVSLELNRHDIYMQLLEAVDSRVLERHVLWETLRKARDLLNAEATINSATERTILKTVATWLGRLTLARNLPIKMKELSLRDLLLQAFDNRRLIVVIPFVCNLLLCTTESTVFRLPNPWMMAMLRILVEFYHFGDIRLNLKFEIEVLFEKIKIELDNIEPANVLRTHIPPAAPLGDLPNRLDLEFQRATAAGSFPPEPQMSEEFARIQHLQNEQATQAAQESFMRRIDELISQLPDYLVFSSDYPIFTAPSLKRVVHHSIDRAIREIINPVVERSVTIAGISSRDLIQKDFGMEPDPTKMRHAAHLMVQNLAGNLALVTCKEPLRTSMITNIRAMLIQNGFTEETMPDPMIAGVVGDNLDAACSVIKKAAMEKSSKDIDVNLSAQYAARKAHRDSRNQQPFFDGASFAVSLSHAALPDHLRLRSGGLSPQQLRVYEDFSEPSRVMTQQSSGLQQISNGENYLPAGYRDLGLNDGLIPPEIKRGPSPSAYDMGSEAVVSPQTRPAQTSLEKFHEIIAQVEKHLTASQVTSVNALPADHELRVLIRAVVIVANQSINREQTTLVISQKVVQYLYKCSSQLGREVYVLMLQQLCDLVPKVNKEVKQWLIYAEDVRKFNVPVTATLIRAGFISAPELDAQLADLIMRSFAPEILDFVSQLVRECALSDRACVSRSGFAASLAAMLKAHEVGRSIPAVDTLLDDLRGRSNRLPSNTSSESEEKGVDSKLQEKLTHYFLEWVRVFQSNKNPEVAFVPYVTFLQKEGILSGEDVSAAFYRSAINCAVDLDASSVDGGPMRSGPMQFFGTDSLAKLIVLIVKNYGDKSGASNVPQTVYYYNKIVTIMSYSLVQRQLEMGESFDQRPWARFFTSMLSELAGIEHALPETYIGCLRSFANVLGITQPTYAPRFAFGWLSIVSHRLFMPKLLSIDDGWSDYHRCMMWLLRFLSPFLKSGDMSPSSRSIFRGTLRILLVLMHDFPEFLVEFYHTLSTAIPTHCVQLRNIILAAFPHSEAPLPDHYKRLDQLIPAMQGIPTIRSDNIKTLNSGNMRAAIDSHVRAGVPAVAAIVGELKNRIAVKTLTNDGPVITWNHTLLHATVFYLGTTAVARRAAQTGLAEFDPKAPEVGILTNLAFAFDAEGQYYLLSVVADQLRYPSAHTLFYISFMLYLFGVSSRSETPNTIPERIGRVLLERVIVRRPHPWGLVIAFVELLDNETYGFWKQPFVRAEEEIFLLFRKAQQNFVGSLQ